MIAAIGHDQASPPDKVPTHGGLTAASVGRIHITLSHLEMIVGGVLLTSLAVMMACKWWTGQSRLDAEVAHMETIIQGSQRQSTFRATLINRGTRALRLVGGTVCGPRGCIEAKPLPIVVPSGASQLLSIKVTDQIDNLIEPSLELYVQDEDVLITYPVLLRRPSL